MYKEKLLKLIKSKLSKIPHGVDRSLFYNQRKKDNDDAQNVSLSGDTKLKRGKITKIEQIPVNMDNHADTFKFLSTKGWRGTGWDRGGVQYLIRAFAEEFKKDEKVELIVKLNPAYMNPAILESTIVGMNLPEDRPLINVRLADVPFNKLIDIYNEADCFVCPTRAESFNLIGLEAMSCGLPTIQTNYGGQVDYMNGGNSLTIDYDMEEVKEDFMYEGISWATPKIEDLKAKLRWAFENQDRMKSLGARAEKDSEKWTWDKTAEKIIKILKK